MAVLDSAIANIALPTIARDMVTTPAATIWVVNAYQFAVTVSLLPPAFLGDILSYKRVYLGVAWRCSPWPRWAVRCRPT